jgi:NAD dependent epimerase/dehydratase family enzyme
MPPKGSDGAAFLRLRNGASSPGLWTGFCQLRTVAILSSSNTDLLADLHVVAVRVNRRVQFVQGGQVQPWVHIDDVVAGLWRSSELR